SWDWDSSLASNPADRSTLPDNQAMPPIPFTPEQQPELRRGSRGDSVTTLQTLLNAYGAGIGVDGGFGGGTETAVRGFQETHALPVTGVVDAATWAALAGGEKVVQF